MFILQCYRQFSLGPVVELVLVGAGCSVEESASGYGKRSPAEQATLLADKLSRGARTHDRPISLRAAQELGLPVRSDMPAEFYQLMSLFPQPTQRQATVQYVPEPYGPPASSSDKRS